MKTLMRLASTAAVAATFVAVPLAAPAHAGCVTDYVFGRQPYLIDGDAFVYNTVHRNPDGSIYIQPMTPVNLALYIADDEADQVIELVVCVV